MTSCPASSEIKVHAQQVTCHPPLPSVIVPPTSKQHLPHCHQGRDFVSPREDGRLAERPGRATVASSLSPSSGMVPAAVGRKQGRQIEAPPAYAGRRAVRSTGTFGPGTPGIWVPKQPRYDVPCLGWRLESSLFRRKEGEFVSGVNFSRRPSGGVVRFPGRRWEVSKTRRPGGGEKIGPGIKAAQDPCPPTSPVRRQLHCDLPHLPLDRVFRPLILRGDAAS